MKAPLTLALAGLALIVCTAPSPAHLCPARAAGCVAQPIDLDA